MSKSGFPYRALWIAQGWPRLLAPAKDIGGASKSRFSGLGDEPSALCHYFGQFGQQVTQTGTRTLRRARAVQWPRNENGEPFPAPRLRCLSLMPWQRPRGVANGAHRKSGVIYRLTSACPAES